MSIIPLLVIVFVCSINAGPSPKKMIIETGEDAVPSDDTMSEDESTNIAESASVWGCMPLVKQCRYNRRTRRLYNCKCLCKRWGCPEPFWGEIRIIRG